MLRNAAICAPGRLIATPTCSQAYVRQVALGPDPGVVLATRQRRCKSDSPLQIMVEELWVASDS